MKELIERLVLFYEKPLTIIVIKNFNNKAFNSNKLYKLELLVSIFRKKNLANKNKNN